MIKFLTLFHYLKILFKKIYFLHEKRFIGLALKKILEFFIEVTYALLISRVQIARSIFY